jgi:hypothetical protein
VALLGIVVAGCGKSPQEQAAEEMKRRLDAANQQMQLAAKQMEEASKQGTANMGAALQAMGAAAGGAATAASGGAKVEPVDFRELKALLPDELGGLPRKSTSGEKSGAFGIVTSTAEGTYSADGKPASLHVKITDPGTLSGFTALGAMWMNAQIDKETDNGYEKTGTLNGRRYHEQYNKSGHGELTMIAGNRFMVEVSGNNVDMNTIKAAMAKIDLAKLDAMQMAGVTPK